MHQIIAWFARNGVAANLLMLAILMAGINTLFKRIPTEIFPEFELDMITVSVPYRGSIPAEVEESVVVKIEEAIQDLQGIKEINSTASEGAGSVSIEVDKGYDSRDLLDDIKNRVDSINTFPVETEKPVINLAKPRGEVITVVLAADMSESDLCLLGEQIRDEIVNLPNVTQVSLQAVRPYEVAIEVSEQTLQQYGLTLDGVAQAIRSSSIDLPAGAIKTTGGEILLRTKGQAYVGSDFENIVLLTRNDGTRLTLGEIAKVVDGFEETPLFARWNGKRCVMIAVARVGNQNAIDLANEVKDYLVERRHTLPPGVDLDYWNDRSKIVKGRIQTLTSSAMQGGFLVFLVLALFLRFSLALWVCLGIPVAFMGALAFMPQLGVTINIISLFGFILVLGIVVDDAIVTGENIYSHLQRGSHPGGPGSLGSCDLWCADHCGSLCSDHDDRGLSRKNICSDSPGGDSRTAFLAGGIQAHPSSSSEAPQNAFEPRRLGFASEPFSTILCSRPRTLCPGYLPADTASCHEVSLYDSGGLHRHLPHPFHVACQ